MYRRGAFCEAYYSVQSMADLMQIKRLGPFTQEARDWCLSPDEWRRAVNAAIANKKSRAWQRKQIKGSCNMKISVKFSAALRPTFAILATVKIKSPTAKQIDRLTALEARVGTNPEIEIPAALVVLLGLESNTAVIVPGQALNWSVSAKDTGGTQLEVIADRGAIIQAWLSAGAPVEWDGQPITSPEPRKKLIRDAAGRFTRAIS